MYERRENIDYYDKKWPGCRLILDPNQIAGWQKWLGGGWAFDWPPHEENAHLRCELSEDPKSQYHFYLHFQYSQSMKETVDSLPSRIHVSGTGTNTFKIPLYDLQPVLELLATHDNYDVIIANKVFDLYENVIQEDELIKSLANITDEDKKEIAAFKQVYEQSEIINHELIEPFRFQYAGIAMMLHIYGVADKLVPGFIKKRKQMIELSKLTSKKKEDDQLSLLIEEYIKSV